MKNKLLVQDNALTAARYEMTALEKNIMYAVMAQIEDTDSATMCYKIAIGDISQHTDKRLRNDDFRDAITRLLTRDFTIKTQDGKFLQATFISSAEYDSKGSVEIEIGVKLRPYLFALKKNFTIFGLEIAMSLSSKYSKRLYEMLCQFKSTGLIRLSILELKERFQLINTEGVEQYTRWSNFEKNVLQTAQTEINEKADFKFDYHLKKKGRKITAIEFTFRKTPAMATVVQMPNATPVKHTSTVVVESTPKDPKHERMVERLRTYGLSAEQINRVLVKHDATLINKALYDLDCNKEAVKNTAAYLLKVFEG
jgi:plasmid replication initiation protein